MDLRTLTDNDFDQLCELAVAMHKAINPATTAFGAINTLMHDVLTQEDFIAIGLFDGDKLVGCTFGHKFETKKFLFSGICVIIKNNEWTKKIIDFSFAYIKEKGYTSWQVDATNPNIGSIMLKYGAVQKFVRYEGAL